MGSAKKPSNAPLHRDATSTRRWAPVTIAKGVAFFCAMALLFSAILLSSQKWVRILDDANLVFHEAGHVFYGLLGSTLGLYGGTLGQLTFPLIATVTFFFRRRPVSTAICGVWFFENFLNIARYMADARARALPLVGGGDHDWFTIFARWGSLASDRKIAKVVEIIGWVGMLSLTAWIVWRFTRDIASRDQSEVV